MDITLEKLTVVFRDRSGAAVPVLDVPSLTIRAGQQVCLVGGSGSGKTTLLNTVAGIVVPTTGQVLFDDAGDDKIALDVASLSEAGRDHFRAQHVGYVFQTFNLLQGLTALENVSLPAHFAGRKQSEARERARSLLDRVGLSHRLDARPGTMSVGEQQRVAIARAVINEPTVVLADEPTANLDVANGDEVLGLLKDAASESESILMLVTHEPRVQEHFDDVRPLHEVSR
ncbi:MAG: ABC transporter ATP-binding protein [Planctomycetes bacterium]|nr:ABC transporter ATP-binding protein [Planctomycetota bacterium]